ncbi:MAG: aminotransferase class V-fold PLP-dependent enzyme [Acidimicrobiia bacterium]|nr:aminotransferase class V-fold PLP-dependent enzyme [Acidimicrobiia bacterium]
MRDWFRFLNRRQFLGKTAVVSAVAHLLPGARPASGLRAAAGFPQNHIYAKLGVRPVINGLATATRVGGSLMPPEVVAAMEEAGKYFVSLPELHEKAGRRLAQLIGVEAALVTTGAAGSMTLGTAACVTGADPQKISRLPDTSGMKNEIIMQKSHRSGYEQQMLLVGTKIIEIETREQLESAITPRTAMLFFLNIGDPNGQIKRAEWVAIGKKHAIPTFNDAAADLPPKSRLSEYVKMGFDLVGFSGGKGLHGPQCSGLLLGRKDLVDAARINASPWGGTIGRGMKVGKEEIMGLLAAVERYLKIDHEAERRELEGRIREITQVLSSIKGLKTEIYVPEIANHVPHLAIEWNRTQLKMTSQDVSEQLLKGEPSIELAGRNWGRHKPKNAEPENPELQGLTVCVWTLRPGEPKIVARRLHEILAPKPGRT